MIDRGAARHGRADGIGGTLAAGLALTLVAFTVASCATPPPREIDATADGSRVVLVPGQELRITLDANPASGYRWVVDRPAAAVLTPVGQPLYTPTSTSVPLVGAGGTMAFDFGAASAGSDTLQLTYRRVTDAAVARSLRVEVVVQVQQ